MKLCFRWNDFLVLLKFKIHSYFSWAINFTYVYALVSNFNLRLSALRNSKQNWARKKLKRKQNSFKSEIKSNLKPGGRLKLQPNLNTPRYVEIRDSWDLSCSRRKTWRLCHIIFLILTCYPLTNFFRCLFLLQVWNQVILIGKMSKLASKRRQKAGPVTSTQVSDDNAGSSDLSSRNDDIKDECLSREERIFQRQLESAIEMSKKATLESSSGSDLSQEQAIKVVLKRKSVEENYSGILHKLHIELL